MKYRRLIERFALLLMSLGAVYFVAYTAYSDLRSTRQRALFYQLQILRMGVNIYQLVDHSNPLTLKDLATKTYRLPGDVEQKRYIEGLLVDDKGRIFDPFGSPYFYDPLTAWVRSTTVGYEFW